MKRKTVDDLVNKYGPLYQKDLGLGHLQVRWHVQAAADSHDAAITMLDHNEISDIVIYYDLAHNRKDVLGSIYHELVHVLFHHFEKCVSRKKKREAEVIEEEMVSKLEKFFVKNLVRGR